MRRIAWLALLAIPAGCASGSRAASEAAPSGNLRQLDGGVVPVRSLWKDQKTLVVFMTTW